MIKWFKRAKEEKSPLQEKSQDAALLNEQGEKVDSEVRERTNEVASELSERKKEVFSELRERDKEVASEVRERDKEVTSEVRERDKEITLEPRKRDDAVTSELNEIGKQVATEKIAEKTLTSTTKEAFSDVEKLTKPLNAPGFLTRLKQGLNKTRHQLGDGLGRLLIGKKEIGAHLLDELEMLLLSADVGVDTTNEIIKHLQNGLARKHLNDGDAVLTALKDQLQTMVTSAEPALSTLCDPSKKPFVILMVGVNGAGKTTTIGKLAKQFQLQGKKVMLAAGDTFRAAAVEQLQTWGAKNKIPVISQHMGADSASVIYDALQSAKAKSMDILIADTAGRLHTQQNLMEELKKIKRVLQKLDPSAPHEIMLVLDASIGQNALNQAKQFNEAMGITGITMTKLDGTAKGGILFAIANELKIPFRYIGIGEKIDDLRPFDPKQFVSVIFNDNI